MTAVEWGNPHWGQPGHNVHVHEGANYLDAEKESDQ